MPHKKGETRRKYDREYYKKNRAESKWCVYKLKDGYVGITKGVRVRMNEHRQTGRDTDGYKILFKSKRPEPCIIVEAFLHWIGYDGCQYNRQNGKR